MEGSRGSHEYIDRSGGVVMASQGLESSVKWDCQGFIEKSGGECHGFTERMGGISL